MATNNEKEYAKFWEMAYDEGDREMDESLCKSVYTLNTWRDEEKAEARKLLEEGYWLHFDSTCIGHTLANIVQMNGIKWAFDEYGFALTLAKRKGWSGWYVRLK